MSERSRFNEGSKASCNSNDACLQLAGYSQHAACAGFVPLTSHPFVVAAAYEIAAEPPRRRSNWTRTPGLQSWCSSPTDRHACCICLQADHCFHFVMDLPCSLDMLREPVSLQARPVEAIVYVRADEDACNFVCFSENTECNSVLDPARQTMQACQHHG